MEIVTAIVTPVVESLMVPVKNHLRYLISCTKYVVDMRTKMRVLNDARQDVEDHKNRNKSNSLEVPKGATSWLQEVEKIDAQVKNVDSINIDGCFNLKGRHKLGRKACKIIQNVDRLMEEKSSIDWTEIPIPLAQVNSSPTPSSDYSEFESRKAVYTEAFNALKVDTKTHMIALCGMGGVGKTTMMEKLQKAVCESKMFDFVIKVAVGEKMNVSEFLQTAVAEQLAIDLKESTKEARVGKLRNAFEKKSDDGKKKFLVILDDLWQSVDLKDIGLSAKPDQGIDFKVLLTSRDQNVCIQIGVESDSIFNLGVIQGSEAQDFFFKFVKVSDDGDLLKIGRDITIRCHGLPIAIKTIARTLNGKSKHVWEDTLSKLEHKDVREVAGEVFTISYEHLADEESKSTLLLCGLFPEDFDTPIEDLLMYCWGLKLFRNVETIREARNRLNTCIDQLIGANLLIRSQEVGCVKMHDLVLAFVLDVCSEGEQYASVVGNMSKWHTKLKNESCKRISLTCVGMHDFPKNLKYPNTSLLKLMHGDESLRFPENFYDEMKNLEVIAYDKMEYPLHFRSLQCSANLRTLCLRECSLTSDCSSIGSLSNLEVLSFAHSNIYELPSNIVNLKELKLLDLTGCRLLCIDDGIFKSLVKLEELYMIGVRRKVNTEGDELFESIKNLHALEMEFFDKDALPQNMSFKNLKRFRISLGFSLVEVNDQDGSSFENTLILVSNEGEQLLVSGMNVLFEKTKLLYLQLNGINDLVDRLGTSLHNLRALYINKCTNLRYLFTIGVANSLKQLELLTIEECSVLETLVDSYEICEAKVITFPALKFLFLKDLPVLTSLCKVGDVIQLPQLEELELESLPNLSNIYHFFLKKEVMNSKLKKLCLEDMEKLEEIWPSQLSNNDQVTSQLRVIEVKNCHSLVNLFPNNPMSLLHHLEELRVEYCDSIEVIFNPLSNNDPVITSQLRVIKVKNCDSLVNLFPSNPMLLLHRLEELTVERCDSIDVIFHIDLGSLCVGESNEGISNNHLRSVKVRRCKELREVWRVKGVNNDLPILGFQAVEYIEIKHCESFRNVFTPTTSNFDMKALTTFLLEANSYEVEEEVNVVAFPSYLIHTFRYLHTFNIHDYTKVEAVFEIESPNSRKLTTTLDNQQPSVPFSLKDLHLLGMERMTHVWKYDWNQFLISQQEPISSPFHNLTRIILERCNRIKYLLSPLMAKLLSNLNSITIKWCDAIEEVLSNIDDEYEEIATSISSHTNTTFFRYLEILDLSKLKSLKRIDGVGAKYGDDRLNSVTTTSVHDTSKYSPMGVAYSSFCRYLRRIHITRCSALLNVIPSHVVGQMPKLEELKISKCNSLREIFETEGVNEDDVGDVTDVGKVNGDMGYAMAKILRPTNITSLELPSLRVLHIEGCHGLKYIFTSSTLESLKKLQELKIRNCSSIQVIVKQEDNGLIASKDLVFPRLKSLTLAKLEKLKNFFSGKNIFHWPQLEKVEIYGCPQMMIFTPSPSNALKLKYMHTGVGKHSLEDGLNFDLTNAPHENQLYNSSTLAIIPNIESLQFPWVFSNLIEVHVGLRDKFQRRKQILPCIHELVKVESVGDIEEVVIADKQVFEGTNDGKQSVDDDDDAMIIVSKDKQVMSMDPPTSSSCIWKNDWWMVSNLSNLTKVSIFYYINLERMFCYHVVASLVKLQDLNIRQCPNVTEIVEAVQDSETKAKEVVSFPCLKSLQLTDLRSLKGFCLGSAQDFQWPSLHTLKIKNCPKMEVFTQGESTAPMLKVIGLKSGLHEAMEDINSCIQKYKSMRELDSSSDEE